jgi:phage-related protein
MSTVRRRWRDYRTAAGRRPVRDFLMDLPIATRAEIIAEMKVVQESGLEAARHVRGDIYEVRISHDKAQYRVLFSNEGAKGRILLALEGFAKKTRRTPPHLIDLALDRLRDWRERGEADKEDES